MIEKIIPNIRLIIFDFDGVFTDNKVYVNQEGAETVCCSRADGLGVDKLRNLGLDFMVLSTESNAVTARRCEKLKIPCVHGCKNKSAKLREIVKEKNLSMTQVAFMGNDVNDLTCLKMVGLPIVVRDANAGVIRYAKYRTRNKGGHDAVREVCDLFEKVLLNGGSLCH